MSDPKPKPKREVTMVESEEEIREAILARRQPTEARKKIVEPALPPPPPTEMAEFDDDCQPFRPTARPPMLLLCVCDDGKTEGEEIRIRGDSFVIGRTQGDLVIPHDGQMSARHAELRRELVHGVYRWVLIDLDSSNGTLVRVSRSQLREGTEIVIGSGRFRFDTPAGSPPLIEDRNAPIPQVTQVWGGSAEAIVPTWTELLPNHAVGAKHSLALPEYWIGRDPRQCSIARPNDPFVSPRHARLFRDSTGQWLIENNRSPNGVWLRLVDRMTVDTMCRFQLGEQRFILRVL